MSKKTSLSLLAGASVIILGATLTYFYIGNTGTDSHELTYSVPSVQICDKLGDFAANELLEHPLDNVTAGEFDNGILCEWRADPFDSRAFVELKITVDEQEFDLSEVPAAQDEIPEDSAAHQYYPEELPEPEISGAVGGWDDIHIRTQRGIDDLLIEKDLEGSGQFNMISRVDDNLYLYIYSQFSNDDIPAGSDEQEIRDKLVDISDRAHEEIPRSE